MRFLRAASGAWFAAPLLIITLITADSAASQPKLTAQQLFAPRNIVEISLRMPAADWNQLCSQSRSFAEALAKEPAESPFTYFTADLTINGLLIKNVSVRKKGFIGSLDAYRPSLKIKLAGKATNSPIAGLDRLTLNNNKQDPSGQSQYLSYRFFNRTGTPASRCSFARVTVNGRYLGLYSNVESIKPPMLATAFGDGSGALYEGTVTDFHPDFVGKFETKNKQATREPLQEITRLLAEENVDLEQLGKRIDIEAFVRFWATESLLGFWDGYTNNQNNFFMYQNPSNQKLYFLPWGADALFTENMPLPPYAIRPRFVHSQSLLANRLYRIPEIQALYHKTLRELLDKHWNEEELLREVDEIERLLKDHVRKENTEFARATRKIRYFIKDRKETLLKEMESGPVKLTKPARRPIYFQAVGTVSGSFNTRWFDATPKDTKALGKVDLVVMLGKQRIELKEVGAYAEHAKWPPVPRGVPKPPSIVFVGKRKSDGKAITLALGMPIESFAPSEHPTTVAGMLFEGPIGWPFTVTRMVGGSVTLEQAAIKTDAPVKGKLSVTVMEMSKNK